MKRRPGLALDLALSLAILVGILFTRAMAAGQFVTWDEPAWVYRSAKFLLALQQGDWAGTWLVGHPGVTVMWSGALSLLWHTRVTGLIAPQQLLAIGALATLDVHDPATMRQLAALLPLAKQGILLLNALVATMLYWLLKRLLDRRYALVAVALLAFDPYYLGLSRVLHMDALASGSMLIAFVGALLWARREGRRYLVVSAIATALAALTKSYGALVAPLVVLILLVARLGARRGVGGTNFSPARRSSLACDLALWSLVGVMVFVALWPAMWVSPLETLRGMARLSVEYATHPGDATTSFFRGAIVQDPGPLFYPTALLLRATPLVMIGAFLALGGVLLRDPSKAAASARRPVTLALLGYVVIYLALITISKKKFDRYMLPALLGADLLAAIGLVGAFDWGLRAIGWRATPNRIRWAASGALALLLAVLQATLLLNPLFPAHYLAYYNPWAGGLERALKTIPVGWGEGVERAAEYLALKPDAADLTVATWAIAGVAGKFPGQLVTLTVTNLPRADYVLLYIGDVQAPTPLVETFRGQTPEFMVILNGVEYAWLYANTLYEALGQELDRVAAPGDVIVANTPSVLQRRYPDLAYVTLDGVDEAEVAAQLRHAAHGAKHIIYLEYDNDYRANEWIVRQLAQYAALLWESPFARGVMHYYALPEEADFHQVLATHPLAVNFAGQLLLAGYDFSSRRVAYRQSLGVGLDWRALRSLDKDYQLFAHLVDSKGRKWGQRDIQLRDANRSRTLEWLEGDSHLCNLAIPIEAGTPPGEYWVEIGLYTLDDLARLEIVADPQQSAAWRLGPVNIIPPITPPAVDELAIPQSLDLRLGNVQILGYALASDRLLAGEALRITLFWRCLKEMHQRYDASLSLERNGVAAQAWRMPPVGPEHTTERWVEGEVLRYPYELVVDNDLPSGDYALILRLLAEGDDQPPLDQSAPLTGVTVEHRERQFTTPPIQYPLKATLGDQVEFLGYDLPIAAAAPGDTLRFTLYWRALRQPRASYMVFTHLLDGSSIVRGQRDAMPLGGRRPTASWVAGEVLVDAYDLPINSDAAHGPHQIEVGMYDPATGERLAVKDASGALIAESRILLAPIITIRE